MGLNISKSIRVGPLNLRLTKSGLGVSVGNKDFRVGFNGISGESIKNEFDKLKSLKDNVTQKVLPTPPKQIEKVIEWPVLTKNKLGISKPTSGRIENTIAMLDFEGVFVKYNLMKHTHEVFFKSAPLAEEMKLNAINAHIREMARKHNYQLSEKICDEHLAIIATQNAYHPVVQWIESEPWDGNDRFKSFYETVQVVDSFDRSLANELIYRWVLSAAAAVTQDNFAAQGCLVFQGNEGIGKTRWANSLVPNKAWILPGEILEPTKKDGLERALSRWIIELGEIDSTFRKTDRAALKTFITRSEDTWRTAFDRRETAKPRRTVCLGSVNDVEFLDDTGEHRRYWVIPVVKMNPDHNINMQQLFAQAAVLVSRNEPWWLSDETKQKLIDSNKQFKFKED